MSRRVVLMVGIEPVGQTEILTGSVVGLSSDGITLLSPEGTGFFTEELDQKIDILVVAESAAGVVHQILTRLGQTMAPQGLIIIEATNDIVVAQVRGVYPRELVRHYRTRRSLCDHLDRLKTRLQVAA